MRPKVGLMCVRIIPSWRSKVLTLTVPLTESLSHLSKYSPTVKLPASKKNPPFLSDIAFVSFSATAALVLR